MYVTMAPSLRDDGDSMLAAKTTARKRDDEFDVKFCKLKSSVTFLIIS